LPAISSNGNKIRLQKELIWEQAEQILDAFEHVDESSKQSFLLVLNRDNVTLYRGDKNRWELADMKRIPPAEKPTRDLRGEIRFVNGNRAQVLLPGKVCDLNLSEKIEMNCQEHSEKLRQVTILANSCSQSTFVLRSDTRDQSLPDRIFLRNPNSTKTEAAIVELEMPGPVHSIFPSQTPFVAGAVVFNLSSGVYEVYRISAVCGN